MSEWQETGMHQVNALLSKDADFQGLSKQLTVAQEHYQTAVGKLPPEERKFIEDYIKYNTIQYDKYEQYQFSSFISEKSGVQNTGSTSVIRT